MFGRLKDEIVPRFFFVSPLCSKISNEILKNSVDLPETSRKETEIVTPFLVLHLHRGRG